MANFISNLASALPQNARSIGRSGDLDVFGGEGGGFAQSVLTEATKGFYGGRSLADGAGVAKGMNAPIPRSIFNEYALFNFRGLYGGLTGSEPFDFFKDVPENPLMGGYNAHNVSISRLIEFFDEHYPKIGYKAQDFLYCKYYKQIPVNHLVTLRRFPVPVTDNIFDLSLRYDTTPDAEKPTFEVADVTQVAGVTAVTYLGEVAGNKLDDLLKFSYGLNWKDIESKMEALESTDKGYTNQPFYSKIGGAGRALVDSTRGISAGGKFRSENAAGGDRFGTTYANFTIGPVNVVNKTAVRDIGLKFENDMKLTFEYELKSLNYVNPKIAMIDLISNMLTMTTNNAQFFGGGHRYYGSGGYVASSFGDMGKLRNGDFGGYIGSVVGQVQSGFKSTFADKNGEFNVKSGIQGIINAGKTLLGNMLGGFLSEQMGAVPSTQATAAFISGEPTGNWHVTVGNPLNPIVMMGNMYCDNTIMTLGHGLGYDDFPMEVKFEVDVKHGKPRDKGDIENMFNAGRGRIYASSEKADDILNLKGLDLATYGSVKAGKINLQKTQSAAQAADVKPAAKPFRKSKGTSLFTDDDSAYVSNVVSMIIDS